MRKFLLYLNLAVTLALPGGIFYMSSGPRPWAVDREKWFIGALPGSLASLDQAKHKWAEHKNKSEEAVPTLEELMPYLEDKGERIKWFMALGINYKVTSSEVPYSDVATLTRDLRFRSGYCLLYRAGTSYSPQTGWTIPPRTTKLKSFNTLWIENNLDHFLKAAFVVLVFGNLLVIMLMTMKKQKAKQATRA